jgi:hypothetical protein
LFSCFQIPFEARFAIYGYISAPEIHVSQNHLCRGVSAIGCLTIPFQSFLGIRFDALAFCVRDTEIEGRIRIAL